MNILNPRNLPEPIVRAVVGDPEKRPDSSRFGVNALVGPPMIRYLMNIHWDEVTVNVEDETWMMLGKAFHLLMEKHSPESYSAEEKIEVKLGDITVVGIPDSYYDDIIDDFKVTSVWSYIYGDKPEWEAVANVYRWLIYKKHGRLYNTLRIVAVLRDWMQTKALREPDYPKAPLYIIPLKTWDIEKTEEYIYERLKAHEELRPCTKEEKWRRPDTWAVMKKGRKTALRVLESEELAKEYLESKGGDFIEFRKGEAVRCLNYCPVRQFCDAKEVGNEQS